MNALNSLVDRAFEDARSGDHALGDSILFRGGLLVGVLTLLHTFIPSVAAVATLYGSTVFWAEPTTQTFQPLMLTIFALSLLIMQPTRSTASQLGHRSPQVIREIFTRWVVLVFTLLAVGFLTRLTPVVGRRVLLTWALVTPVIIVFATLTIRNWMRVLVRDVAHQRRVLFAGCNETSLSLARRIRDRPELCMSVGGFFDDRSVERLGYPGVVVHGGLASLANYVRQNRVDIIFVALPIRHLKRVQELMEDLRDTTASIYYVPDVMAYDLIQSRPGDVCGMPVIAMCETPLYGLRGLAKRLFDIVAASLALVALAPLLAAIVLAVRLTSPGPAIFRQRRYGLDGQEIIVFKFRTMTVAEDGSQIVQASRTDKRVTSVGRFLRRTSMDELPQLINVLQGRMSLVGPRPHAVAHNEIYRKLIKGYMVRHKVLPGITGLAQIKGFRGETREVSQMESRVRLDLEYLRHWSIFLDLKIIVVTALQVFTDKQAY